MPRACCEISSLSRRKILVRQSFPKNSAAFRQMVEKEQMAPRRGLELSTVRAVELSALFVRLIGQFSTTAQR
jgi:hypothetical protein